MKIELNEICARIKNYKNIPCTLSPVPHLKHIFYLNGKNQFSQQDTLIAHEYSSFFFINFYRIQQK
jgi:hypothetical protein